jgi:hypothetical protein
MFFKDFPSGSPCRVHIFGYDVSLDPCGCEHAFLSGRMAYGNAFFT